MFFSTFAWIIRRRCARKRQREKVCHPALRPVRNRFAPRAPSCISLGAAVGSLSIRVHQRQLVQQRLLPVASDWVLLSFRPKFGRLWTPSPLRAPRSCALPYRHSRSPASHLRRKPPMPDRRPATPKRLQSLPGLESDYPLVDRVAGLAKSLDLKDSSPSPAAAAHLKKFFRRVSPILRPRQRARVWRFPVHRRASNYLIKRSTESAITWFTSTLRATAASTLASCAERCSRRINKMLSSTSNALTEIFCERNVRFRDHRLPRSSLLSALPRP